MSASYSIDYNYFRDYDPATGRYEGQGTVRVKVPDMTYDLSRGTRAVGRELYIAHLRKTSHLVSKPEDVRLA